MRIGKILMFSMILLSLLIVYLVLSNLNIACIEYIQKYIPINYTEQGTSNNSLNSSITTPLPVVDNNSTLLIPPNDYVINNINWSSYPNLQNGYVLTAYVAKSNDVIKHDFIEVQINIEIKGTDDEKYICDQLARVAREARNIYGQNADINTFGTIGGVMYYHYGLFPYDEYNYYRGINYSCDNYQLSN